MASDLSSGCTDDIEIFDEKEEGEISLEDVSSSEESHRNYKSGFRTGRRCSNCMSLQQCSSWCNAVRVVRRRSHRKQDAAVHGKENRRHVKDSSGTIGKHAVSTLQEKNDDDLVPISSDSDMEIVGLPGNSKQVTGRNGAKLSKVRKKKKKKRNHSSVTRVEDSLEEVDDVAEDPIAQPPVRSSRSHHRESISPRYDAGATSLTERTVLRSPSRRYRAARTVKSRSPLRRSRSPVANHASTTVRKLPRKLRSSRRTPSRSPPRFGQSRESRDSGTPPAYVDVYATELLKKVRRLKSVGNFSPKNQRSRRKEHSSLKEKLSNMMKNRETIVHSEKTTSRNHPGVDSTRNERNATRGSTSDVKDPRDDEDDDIELLRQLALKTKQKKTESKNDEGTKETSSDNAARAEAIMSDDNDSEALELRMIALHSAVMKKHRNRVERGLGSKKSRSGAETRDESPFNSLSFLESIPIPGEVSDASVDSPARKSPIGNDDTNNPEDMELDTDVEREKDSMPYSPTDELTIQEINVDVPLITGSHETPRNDATKQRQFSGGIVNSDDPIGSSNYGTSVGTPYSPSLPTITPKSADPKEQKITTSDNETRCSPDRSGYTSAESLANYMENPDAPYSPSKPVEASRLDYLSSPSKSVVNIETPYSPTDVPIYDPELTRFSPDPTALASNDPEPRTSITIEKNSKRNEEVSSSNVARNLVPMMLNMSVDETVVSRTDVPATILSRNDRASKSPSLESVPVEFSLSDDERVKSYEAIIDELPEIDLDGSPLVPVTTESSNLDIRISLTPEISSITTEPLYLQGLPDVTRDTNKIPTLVNRTLVPAPILKTNKQLQQPLPQKKTDNHNEPSFKSAEMRPVSKIEIIAVRPMATNFKPIKLCPISKKSQVIVTTAAAFNSSSADDTTVEGVTSEEPVDLSISEMIKLPPGKMDTATAPLAASSLTPEESLNFENARKKLRKSVCHESTKSPKRSASSSPVTARVASKVKAKSVETCTSNSSGKQGKSTNNRASRRASSSSSIGKLASRKGRSNDKSSGMDSSTGKSKKTSRGDAVSESCSEMNDSKNSRKKNTHHAGRKIRERRRRFQNSVKKAIAASPLKNRRRRSENAKKSTKKSAKLDESGAGSRVTKSKSTSFEMRGSADRELGRTSDKSSNEELVVQAETALTMEKLRKKEETEKNRRCSLDEDEEALRALLLASLPKRVKTVESVTPEALNPIVKVTRLSDTTLTDTSAENSSGKLSKQTTACNNDSPVFATPKALQLSSSSSSPASSVPRANTVAPIEQGSRNIPGVTSTDSILSSSSPLTSLSALTTRKRPGSVLTKNPPKKILKKALPVLVSTKVVNNAKKYQNAMLQKKLNLQRAVSLYSGTNGSRNITLNNLKTYDTGRPSSPKITTNSSLKMQRLVINLESDTDSEAELQNQRKSSSNVSCGGNVTTSETRKPLSIPTTDFEKSVVQFLKDQRKKMESIAITTSATSSTITTTTMKSTAPSSSTVKVLGTYSTPLAVRRHLPVSQQEEYRRLKQQIMERERQMLQKNLDSGTISQNPSSKSPCTPPGPLSPASPIAATLAPKLRMQRPCVNQLAGTIDDDRGRINVTKISEPVAPAVVNKLLVKSVVSTSKVISRVPSVSNNPASTSTPKSLGEVTQSSSTTKISSFNNVTAKTYLPTARPNVTVTTENSGNLVRSKISGVSPRLTVVTSTSVSTIGKGGRSLVSTSSLPTTSVTSGSPICGTRTPLKPTEMLTIQIPNDKIQTDRSSSLTSKNTNNECTDAPTNCPRNSGVLRILTKEQLNNRFVKIQVERGPAGRRVTVGSPISPEDSSTSVESPVSRTLPKASDKIQRTAFCDSSLSVNESKEVNRNGIKCSRNDSEKNHGESSANDSEASTLILTRNENASTVDNSTASTLILSRDDSESRENLESTRFSVSDREGAASTRHGKIQVKEVWEKIRSDVKNELKVLVTLSTSEQEKMLLETQENLVAKRNMVLEDLTEMSGCLRQWEFEREIQTKLIAEVRRLREQLKTAEDRLNEQRCQMNDMGPRVTRTHKKINQGRRECYKLSRICQGLGTRVVGQNYKIPNTGARLLNERLKEVAVHTRQLSKKKVPAYDSSLSETKDVASSSPSVSAEPIRKSSKSALSKNANRIDTPSTSMSETDDNDDEDDNYVDDDDLNNETRRETGSSVVSIGELSEPIKARELEDSAKVVSSICPSGERNSPEKENGKSRLTEANEREASCSSEINDFMSELAVSSLPEGRAPSLTEVNAPSKETEHSDLSTTKAPSKKTDASSSSRVIDSTSEIEFLSLPEMDTQSSEAEAPSLIELSAPSMETKDSPKRTKSSSSSIVNATTMKNSLSLDTVQNNDSENTKTATTSTETNLASIVPDANNGNHADDNVCMPGTSRSDSPAFRLLNESQSTGKQKFDRYSSVLTHLKIPRNVNLNGILCPYELMGTCNDGDCQYYHLDPDRHCQ